MRYWFYYSVGTEGFISDDFPDFGSRLKNALASTKCLWIAFAVEATDIDAAEKLVKSALAGENVPTVPIHL